jgi:hypothetical protein
LLQHDALKLWTPEEIENGQTSILSERDQHVLTQIAVWSRDYLSAGNPDLGRDGPVCPFTQPSIKKQLYYIATPQVGADSGDIYSAVLQFRDWYDAMGKEMEQSRRNLLTFLIPLPDVDLESAEMLDELQNKLKNDFVRDGLMIGQFHPKCEQGGLWNEDFRPLRCPVPMLVIRVMVLYDLPFLMDDEVHVDAYLANFAKEIPPRVRAHFLGKLFATR